VAKGVFVEMKHLVLGSAGQIGHPLCNFIKAQGDEVITFDLVTSEKEDLRVHNNSLLEESISKADFIYFLAFDVGGSRYLEQNQDKSWFIMNNMQLMMNTFKCIKEHSKPFLFASSQMADMKHSTYGGLKFIGERMTSSLGGTITRFWNVYGPERDLQKAHVITDFALSAKREGKIEMLTNGEETRQFLHAEDCSRALYMISKDSKKFAGQSLDVTNFEWTSIKEIAHIVSSICGDVPVIPGVKEDTVQKLVDVPPSEAILQYWKPNLTLREGIRDVISSIEEIHGKVS
jgi:nucleoside-diphosphate-sugar epimerase